VAVQYSATQRDYVVFDDHIFCQEFVQMQDGRSVAYLMLEGLKDFQSVRNITSVVSKIDEQAEIVVNLAREEAILCFVEAKTKLSKLVAAIENEGFLVIPNRKRGSSKRDDLMRLGMGYFALMNIMLFASADYFAGSAGISPAFFHLFRWAGCLFSTLAIIYLGEPIFRISLVGLLRKQVKVEQAIIFAIIVTWGYSTWNTFRGEGPIWFDSATMVMVLLTTGRFFQRSMVEKAIRKSRGYLDFSSEFVRIMESGVDVQRRIFDLKVGDRFKVLPGELLPVSSKLVSAKADVSYAAITGEPKPLCLTQGNIIESGAVNLGRPAEFIALQNGSESWIHKMTSDSDRLLYERGSIAEWTDQAASYFFMLVIALAGLCFYIFRATPIDAMSRVISMLLIACPCAFAIATPLAYSKAIYSALKLGVSFKSQAAIEQLAKVRNIIFDKTGTLTKGISEVSSATVFNPNGAHDKILLSLLSSLSKYSTHHVAFAISRWASSVDHAEMNANELTTPNQWDCLEVNGEGLKLSKEGKVVKVGRLEFVDPQMNFAVDRLGEDIYSAFVSLNNQVVWGFKIQDLPMENIQVQLDEIRKLNLNVELLSGDQKDATAEFASSVGVERFRSEATPEDKLAYLEAQTKLTAMVGNGWNDMKAMSHSGVSIAVLGATQALKDRADVSLSKPGILGVLQSIVIARGTRRALLISFAFALTYNIAGIVLGFTGIMTPVLAAITMPINSLVVTLLATSGVSNRSVLSFPLTHGVGK
jgi:Cu2+-exporting ATPase